MPKKLDRAYIRADAVFTQDEKYIALPSAFRDSAYLFFLALNGWSRTKTTDGRVPGRMAEAIAGNMGHSPAKAARFIAALASPEVALVRLEGDEVILPSYSKWQDTKAEIEANIEAKREAGRRGGVASGRSRREASAKADAEASASAGAVALAQAKTKQNEAERERERENSYGALRLLRRIPPGFWNE